MGLGRRIGIAITALVVSVFLWSYVHLSQSYEADVDIPIVLTPPHGMALTSGIQERLHTRIRGAGWQILTMGFTHSSYFQLDLSERAFADPTVHDLIIHADDLVHMVVLPSEIKLVRVEPDSIKMSFGVVVQRRIPLRVPMEVVPAAGYAVIGKAVMAPATILVEGSKDILDSLSSYPTKPLHVAQAREDIDKEVELLDTLSNEIKVLQPQPIRVKVNIEALAERVFANVPIEVEAVPPGQEVLFIPGDVSVTLRGGVDQLSNLSPSQLRAHVVYDAMEFDTAQRVKPVIDYPAGTSFLLSSPERVRFVVRKKSPAKNGDVKNKEATNGHK
jgi:hypothetical protein